MARPPEDGPGPPDRQTLRLLERVLGEDPIVDTTAFEPDGYEPRLLSVRLDADRYPQSVTSARLDVRWFVGGDFSLHYVETTVEDRWECRWDRHPNPHSARVHFHRPPDGEETDDLDLPSLHPLDVTRVVLAAVDRRFEGQWSADGT